IGGAGTPRIVVEGVEKLHGARHTVLPDRIEAGTYAMAVAMTGGEVQLAGARPELLQSALDVLTEAGAVITVNKGGIRVARDGTAKLRGAPVMATDLRASVSLVIAGLAAEGETMVNRIYHLDRGFERLEEKLSACGASIQRISD